MQVPGRPPDRESVASITQQLLMEFLVEFKSEAFFADLMTELQSIQSIYDNLSVKTEVSQQEIKHIGEKVEGIRNKIIKG